MGRRVCLAAAMAVAVLGGCSDEGDTPANDAPETSADADAAPDPCAALEAQIHVATLQDTPEAGRVLDRTLQAYAASCPVQPTNPDESPQCAAFQNLEMSRILQREASGELSEDDIVTMSDHFLRVCVRRP